MSDQSTSLPATISDAAVNILKETARANPLLRFKKGKYLIGEDEIPAGREYVAFPLEWTRGWVKWEGGQIVDERVGKVGEGFVLLERDELGATMADMQGARLRWQAGRDARPGP